MAKKRQDVSFRNAEKKPDAKSKSKAQRKG